MEGVYPGSPPTGVDASTCKLGVTPSPAPSDPRTREVDGEREDDDRGDKGAGADAPSCPAMTSPKTDQSSSSSSPPSALDAAGDGDECVNLRMLDATRCNADGRRTGMAIAVPGAAAARRASTSAAWGEDVVQRRGKRARPDTVAARAWAWA